VEIEGIGYLDNYLIARHPEPVQTNSDDFVAGSNP
jgi:hypothetical protein